MKTNTGIGEAQSKEIAGNLGPLLADTYTLYLKTQNFHWNVTGAPFQTLHTMFQTQYTELAAATDLVAERIRALGQPTPGTFREFSKLTSIPEPDGVPSSTQMIQQLLEGHETVTRTARSILAPATSGNDQVTVDLVTQRMQIHEKTSWMLRSLLQS